jgi:hypothetical protein
MKTETKEVTLTLKQRDLLAKAVAYEVAFNEDSQQVETYNTAKKANRMHTLCVVAVFYNEVKAPLSVKGKTNACKVAVSNYFEEQGVKPATIRRVCELPNKLRGCKKKLKGKALGAHVKSFSDPEKLYNFLFDAGLENQSALQQFVEPPKVKKDFELVASFAITKSEPETKAPSAATIKCLEKAIEEVRRMIAERLKAQQKKEQGKIAEQTVRAKETLSRQSKPLI